MFKLNVLYSFALLFLVLNGSSAKVAPSYIKTCPGLKSDCLKPVVQELMPIIAKGIPELGIASIDPLRKDHVQLVLKGGLTVDFRDGSLTGLRKCTIDSVSYKNNEANLKMHCDLTLKGLYKANGKILIVPINGDGKAKIKLYNAAIVAKITFEDKVRDGVVYHEVKTIEITSTYGDRVTFALTNLFQGNPELSETVLQFLNQNSKEVSAEFGKPLVDKIVDIGIPIIKRFFSVIPKNELFVE